MAHSIIDNRVWKSNHVTSQPAFQLSPRITVLPIGHGSGDMAQEVRETLLTRQVDCLAIPLPPSVEEPVEQAVERLPFISVVVIPEADQGCHPHTFFRSHRSLSGCHHGNSGRH